MSRILTPALQVRSRTLIRRERELPLQGEVLKQPGDWVKAEDVVARAQLPGNLQILRVSEKMGIEPFEVMKGLRVKAGDALKKGDLICEHRGLFGLFRSTYLSPDEGNVEYVAEKIGHLGLRGPARSVEINAYLDGRVSSVREGKSASIECEAAFVQGIFGVGGERRGVLTPFKISPGAVIDEDCIPLQAQGQILFGGMKPGAAALKLAAERGALGLVTGSIDDRALAAYLGYDLGLAMTGDEAVSMTLIITEGFGDLPMSARALDLLTQHTGRQASINGATQVRAGAVRPEVIVPFSDFISAGEEHSRTEADASVLQTGSVVRITRYPWFGVQGSVAELPAQLVRLETGALSRIARIKLEDGAFITVSRANLELV